MYIISRPDTFDIVVTSNLFGDILSDGAVGMVGGLGMAPSGNVGDDYGLFEPIHGSAPDIAGKGLANPTATILTSVMMLRYLKENEAADRVEKALEEVLSLGLTTPDLGGTLSTSEMGRITSYNVCYTKLLRVLLHGLHLLCTQSQLQYQHAVQDIFYCL